MFLRFVAIEIPREESQNKKGEKEMDAGKGGKNS
jgi:hypothetical protein